MLGLRGLAPRQLRVFGLFTVLAAGAGFAVLLALVQATWPPLRMLDRGAAEQVIGWVSGRPVVVATLQVVTLLGDGGVIAVLLGSAAVWLLIRRRAGLAGYVVVTGLGATILVAAVKELVGRARPMLAASVSVAEGASFPSGHALYSVIGYGVLLVVLLPVASRRARLYLTVASGVVVLAVGLSRLALGVHFLSDVVAGWLLGLAWLGVATAAFQRWRRATDPRGCELLPWPWRVLAALVVAGVMVLGLVFGASLL